MSRQIPCRLSANGERPESRFDGPADFEVLHVAERRQKHHGARSRGDPAGTRSGGDQALPSEHLDDFRGPTTGPCLPAASGFAYPRP